MRLLAPVEPGKIVAVGLNYRAHAEELAMAVQAEPIIFLKASTSVTGPGEHIVLPHLTPDCQWTTRRSWRSSSARRRRKNFKPEDRALDYMLGYTCGNDVSARDRSGSSTPVGAGQELRHLLPARAVDREPTPRPRRLGHHASPQRRRSCKAIEHQRHDLQLPPAHQLLALADRATLRPGTVIMTGTPRGVGPLAAGQTVTIAVEGVGELTNPVA